MEKKIRGREKGGTGGSWKVMEKFSNTFEILSGKITDGNLTIGNSVSNAAVPVWICILLKYVKLFSVTWTCVLFITVC